MNAVAKAKSDVALPRYEDMCRAIAECHRVDEAKDYRDRAEALRAYAKQASNREAEVQFAEIKVRAEIKCGELLVETAKNGQRERGGRGPIVESQRVTQLKDLGISKEESSRYQQAFAAPAERVEAAFKEARETQVPVTSAQIRAMTKQPTSFTPEQRDQHDREFRVISALRAIAEQDCAPAEYIDQLPDYMRPMVAQHFDRAREWLVEFFKLWEGKE